MEILARVGQSAGCTLARIALLRGIQNVVRRSVHAEVTDTMRRGLREFAGGSVDLAVDSSGKIATMCINHPEKRNAFSGSMMVDLDSAVTTLENQRGIHGLLVYGSDSGDASPFCSGGDLDFVKKNLDKKAVETMSLVMQNSLNRLQLLPIVSVALLNGPALGGGAEVAITCDVRVVTGKAWLQFVQSRVGLATGWGGETHLVKLVGHSLALELLCSGRKINSEEMIRMGMASVSLSIGETGVMQEALNWMRNCLLVGKPEVTRAIKTMVNGSTWRVSSQALSNQRQVFSTVWGGPAHIEALAVMANKKIK